MGAVGNVTPVDSESERAEQCGHSSETGSCQLLFRGKRVDTCPQDTERVVALNGESSGMTAGGGD